MNETLKSWLIGAANAALSGVTTGASGLVLGIGWKKAAIMLGVSAVVSLGKWYAQHPIPGGV
jgi:hypothetical protein